MPERDDDISVLSVGRRVRIRHSRRAPNRGRYGVIVGMDRADIKGAYLVRFEDGTHFRYNSDEFERPQSTKPDNRKELLSEL